LAVGTDEVGTDEVGTDEPCPYGRHTLEYRDRAACGGYDGGQGFRACMGWPGRGNHGGS